MASPSDVDPLAGINSTLKAGPGAEVDPLAGVTDFTKDYESKGTQRSSDWASGSALHAPAYAAQQVGKGIIDTAKLPSEVDSILHWAGSFLPDEVRNSPTANAALDAASSAINPVGAIANKVSQLAVGKNATDLLKPSPETVDSATNALGLNSLKPQNVAEDLVGGASSGLGSAVPFAIAEPESAPMQLGAGVAGGLAGKIAEWADPGSTWAPVIAGALGGLSTGMGIHYFSHLADLATAKAAVEASAKELAAAQASKDALTLGKANELVPNFDALNSAKDAVKQAQVEHETAANVAIAASKDVQDASIAAARAQIDTSKTNLDLATKQHEANVVSSAETRDQAIAKTQETIADSKGQLDDQLADLKSRARQSEASRDAAIDSAKAGTAPIADEDIESGLKSIADKHSTEIDPDKVGEIGQAQARNFVTSTTGSLAKAEDAAWAPLNAKMAEAGSQEMPGFEAAVNAAKGRGGALAETLAKVVPNNATGLAKTLEKFVPDEATGIAAPGPSFADMKELRSALGEARGNPMALKDIGEKNLTSMYAALTSDMRAAAEKAGMADAFDAANGVSKEGRDFVDGVLSKIAASDKPQAGKDLAPGEVVHQLLTQAKNTGTTLAALRARPEFKNFVDGLAAVQINKAIASPKEWQSLAPGAKAALVPEAADRAAIETLLADKGRAVGDSAPAIKAAHDAHLSNLEQIEAERLAASQAHKTAVANAKAEAEYAKTSHKTNVEESGRGLEAASQAHKATVEKATDLIAQAKAAHAEDKVAARTSTANAIANARAEAEATTRGIRRGNVETQAEGIRKGLDVSGAQRNLASAKEHLASFSPTPSQHGINALVGADLGEHLGDVSGHLLGLSGIPYHASALVGAALPTAIRGVKNFLTSPGKTRSAVQGGIGGSEAGSTNPLLRR